ncbi:hypothetical protein B0J17DRAFT_707733 [Rhizoctonia solani]|nr:hypothetical protein B0J17DRAFT_707733 [Rhizoctonia solani]
MTRVAIVTGAAQGIGRAVAHRLAKSGVSVAVADIPPKKGDLDKVVKEIEALGQKAIAVTGDVSKESDVQAIVQQTVEVFGGLDIMVANAGINKTYSILELPEDGFDRIMNVNVKGVLYCYRAAAVQMIKQGRGGRIIGAASRAGVIGERNNAAYCASKFAVRAITQTAALEWGQHNITVNSYAPGIAHTEMLTSTIGAPENIDKIIPADAAIRRIGSPDEIAAAVNFLASEEAGYVTGMLPALDLLDMTKVAIVTGGAQGIGRAIALRLAADGMDVAILDLATKQDSLERVFEEITATGRKSLVLIADVSKEQEVQNAVKQTIETLGGLDVMVANAGIYQASSVLDDEVLDKVLGTNLKGVLYSYRAAAVHMIQQGRGGRIIGASSTSGIQSTINNAPYAVSKFGVRAITQTAALEWGQHGITVNAYAPGVIVTPLGSGGGSNGENYVEMLMGNAANKRAGQPEEVASLVSFLASEGADYITGQTISLNGGFMLT